MLVIMNKVKHMALHWSQATTNNSRYANFMSCVSLNKFGFGLKLSGKKSIRKNFGRPNKKSNRKKNGGEKKGLHTNTTRRMAIITFLKFLKLTGLVTYW